MEATRKRSLKAKARFLNKLAFSLVGLAFLFLAGTIVVRSRVEGEWSGLTAVLLMCGFLLPLIVGAIIGMSSGMYIGELR